MSERPWDMNDGSLWRPSCGNMIARDTDETIPEECHQCGFPDPDAVADYHCGPDDDDDGLCDCCGETWEQCRNDFDCGLMPNGQCTKAGSEECDWDCGRLR